MHYTQRRTRGLGLLCLALLLAACQSGGSSTSPVAGPPGTEASPAAAAVAAHEVGFTEGGAPFRGDPAAPVVLEEFSSYQCPYCQQHFRENYPQILANYVDTGQVLYVFRDSPRPSQPHSPLAAQAARCAGRAGGAAGYWSMHDRLFEQQGEWSTAEDTAALFKAYAADLGLDSPVFDRCLDTEETRAQVEADAADGTSRGVRGTPTFYLNGQILEGYYPYAAFAQAIEAVLAGETLPAAGSPAPGLRPTPAAITIAGESRVLGNPDAAVTIVEFSDYQDTFSQRYYEQSWPQLRAEFVDTGRVRYVIKDFPLVDIHPEAAKAHEAARCAGEQGAYWEMRDRLFEGQKQWAYNADHLATFKRYAVELGLDPAGFDACVDSGRWAPGVSADVSEGLSLGIPDAPIFFINGYPLAGAQPYKVFQQAIELAEQDESGEAPPPRP